MTTHRNHYVPQWYQKRFLKDSKRPLYYLDLNPERTILPTGEVVGPPALQKNSPKNCFWARDLYTTTFGNIPNDEIERFLFGAIDNDGANALRAVVDGDLRKIHDLFRRFFEYLDAQKLRTPKGLDWIQTHYPQLTQLDLMGEMQHLRQMHVTMWLEAVREIVSAEQSDVKFVISDHPITIYHLASPPESDTCKYPNDPDVTLRGSQTLFPLDQNHCLILTNLEYAREPDRTDLMEPRVNARHFGHTIARIDNWIRARRLSAGEVTSINYILKSRARRFVAAAEESWLYPEKVASGDWKSHSGVLLPPKKELWRFGGEIYVGHKDGTSDYQDAFGRTSRSHEYLRKEVPKAEPSPAESCPCGSGRTFEACCKDLARRDRVPWDVYSIRERNLMLFRATRDILGLSRGKTWEDVRRELSDEHVKRIHTAYSALFPRETDIAQLLPRPDKRVFRGFYIGLIDPRTIAVSVLGWLRYFDEILLLNPFMNAAYIKPEYSPIDSPGQYKDQTLKNVALLDALAPYIHAGRVHLIPDPTEINITFRDMIWAIAKERVGKVKVSREDMRVAREFGRDDLKRMIARLPDEDLRHQIRRSSPEIGNDKLEEVIRHIREQHREDPLGLIQSLVMGEEGGQLQAFKSTNFELALFIAQLTGSAIYADQQFTKGELASAQVPSSIPSDGNQQLTLESELGLRFILDGDPAAMERVRNLPVSRAFRRAVHDLWNAAIEQPESSNVSAPADALRQVERAASATVSCEQSSGSGEESAAAVLDIDASVVVPPRGYSRNAAQRFLITFGRGRYIRAVPLAILFGAAVRRTPA